MLRETQHPLWAFIPHFGEQPWAHGVLRPGVAFASTGARPPKLPSKLLRRIPLPFSCMQNVLERCPNCSIMLGRMRGQVQRWHRAQHVLSTLVGTVKRTWPRAPLVRQLLFFIFSSG